MLTNQQKKSKNIVDSSQIDLTKELEFACKVAQEASVIINTFYVGAAEIQYKAENEPVTEADRSANQHIITRIKDAFPKDGILSEESKDDFSRLKKDRVWIIDPLDGTKEFISRNGEFSVMIGLSVGGRAMLGVIMQPDPGLLYSGVVGQGAHLHEADEQIPLHVSMQDQVSQMSLVCSRSHRPKIVDSVSKALHISSERVSGSVGLKVSLISRQLSDLYLHPSPGCKEWDLCGPHAFIEAAGGQITDCWGNPIRYNKRDVRAHNGMVVSNGQAHDEIVEAVANACEELGYNEDDGFW